MILHNKIIIGWEWHEQNRKNSCKEKIKLKDWDNEWGLKTGYVNHIGKEEKSMVSSSMSVIDFTI
jgi:hypothetical protein